MAFDGAAAVPATVMATSVTQEAPWLPHDFTCNTCAPVGAATAVFTEVAYTIVVLVLLSSEYPIAEIDCDEQGVAVACSANGEDTCAPAPGLITVTFENADAAHASSQKEITPTLFRISDLPLTPSSRETACKISLASASAGRTTTCRCARQPKTDLLDPQSQDSCFEVRQRAIRVNAEYNE